MSADLLYFLTQRVLFAFSTATTVSSILTSTTAGISENSIACDDDGDVCHTNNSYSSHVYSQHNTTTDDFYTILLSTAAATSSYSNSTIFLLSLCLSVALTVIHNLIAFYKFVAAWNLIARARRVDLARAYHTKQRRRTVRDCRQTQVHVDSMGCSHMHCPICLEDFYEQEPVTACDDGCQNWFHKECLFDWLEYSNNCPCCRKDLITTRPKGWVSAALALLWTPCQESQY